MKRKEKNYEKSIVRNISDEVMKGMGEKAKRGAINTLTGWIEIPAQIAKGYEYGWMGKENTGWVGAIGGIFAGIGTAAGRTLSGMGELSGFWAADPEDNERIGIPLDAEYAWEEGMQQPPCKLNV